MIFTVQKKMEYLRTARRLKPRQARWALFFSRFNFHNNALDLKMEKPLSLFFPDTPEKSHTWHNPVTEPEISSLRNHKGFLWHQDKICVPWEVRLQTLKRFHDHQFAGHFGVRKTIDLVQRYVWWP